MEAALDPSIYAGWSAATLTAAVAAAGTAAASMVLVRPFVSAAPGAITPRAVAPLPSEPLATWRSSAGTMSSHCTAGVSSQDVIIDACNASAGP